MVVSCSLNVSTVTCVLPGSSSYDPTSAEKLEFRIGVSQLLGPSVCVGDTMLTATVVVVHSASSALGNAAAAVDTVGTVATGTGSILGLIGGASMLDFHVLVLLMNSPCGSTLDQKRVEYMMYVVSPFFAINYEAVVLGNMGVTAAVSLVQLLIARHFRQSRGIAWLDACAAVYFPSFAMKVAELMYVGIAIAGFSLVREHATFSGTIIGVIGLEYVLLLPVTVALTIRLKVHARMVQYTQFLSRPFAQRLLLPWGFWTPEVMERAYGRHIGSFLPGFRMYLSAYPMVVAGLAAMFTHLIPNSVSCFGRFIAAGVIFFAAAALLVAVRPHRIHASTGFAAAVYVVLGVLSVTMAAAYQAPSVTLENAKLAVCAVLVVLMVARVVLDGVTTFFEWKYWRHFREQNKDAMQDGGVAGSASERINFDYDVDAYDLGGAESGVTKKDAARKARGGVKDSVGEAASIQMGDLMDDNEGTHMVPLTTRTESMASTRTETPENEDEGSLSDSESPHPSAGSSSAKSASITTTSATPPAPKQASMVSGSSTSNSDFSSSSELL